jgi:hypothetical protein
MASGIRRLVKKLALELWRHQPWYQAQRRAGGWSRRLLGPQNRQERVFREVLNHRNPSQLQHHWLARVHHPGAPLNIAMEYGQVC